MATIRDLTTELTNPGSGDKLVVSDASAAAGSQDKWLDIDRLGVLANTNVWTGDNSFTEPLGIGTSSPAQDLHVLGIAQIERVLSSTNGFSQVLLVEATSTGDMVDPFGSALSFRIKDTANVDNTIGLIGARRNGADNSGDIVLTPYSGGAEAPSTRITKDGRLGVAITTPLGQAHVDQSSSTAAIPVLVLDQADVSEEFIEFDAAVGTGNPIDTAAIGTYYGKIRVSVNGTFKYIALYNS